MKIIYFFLFHFFIYQSYCGYQNHFHEELALLTFLAGKISDNQPVREQNVNPEYQATEIISMLINVGLGDDYSTFDNPYYNVEFPNSWERPNLEIMANIENIIPTLRSNMNANNLFGRSVTFEELYNLSIDTLNKYFNLFRDPNDAVDVRAMNENDITTNGQDILNRLDVFYQLTRQFIRTENDNNVYTTPIGLFEEPITITRTNDNKYKLETKVNVLNPSNGHDNLKLQVPESQKIHSISIIESEEQLNLIKYFITTCKSSQECSDLFNKNYNSMNKNKIIILKSNNNKFHPIVADEIGKQFAHPFAIKKNGDSLELDIEYAFKNILFERFATINGGYGKHFHTDVNNNNEEIITDKGIGILSLSGFKITNFKDNLRVNFIPIDYKIDNDNVRFNIKLDSNHNVAPEHYNKYFPLDGSTDYKNDNTLKNDINYKSQILNDEGIVSEYIDPMKYASNDRMMQRYVEKRSRYNEISVRELLLAKYLSGILLSIKMFPFGKENLPVGIGVAGSHPYQIVKTFNTLNTIQREINYKKNYGTREEHASLSNEQLIQSCSITPVRNTKRSEIGCKYTSLNLIKIYDTDSSLLDTLKFVNEKNIDNNIMPKYSNINEINNISDLHKNAETIEDVWKELINIFINNFNEFTEEESTLFLINFNNAINGYKEKLSNSKYLNQKFTMRVNEESIILMNYYFNKIKNLHEEKFGNVMSNDGNELIYINEFNKDSQSYLYKYKLLRIIKKLTAIINKNQGNIVYGISIITDQDTFSSEINPKSILESETLDEARDKICDGIENLDDDSFNDELSEIGNELFEIKKSNDREYEETGETSTNSEMVHSFYNSIARKQGFPIDDDVKPSENFLSVPGLENIDFENQDAMINIFKNNDISIEDKEYIFNGLKLEIINSDPENERLPHRIYSVVHNLDIFIKQENEKINSFTSDIGHERYITNFISLTSNYNNLVAVAINHGVIYSDKLSINEPIKPIELDNNILQRYNYIINKQLIVAIKEVAKNNPTVYDDKYEFKDAFGKTYTWGKSVIKEVTLSDLNNMRKDGKIFSTKTEHMTEIIGMASDGISTALLKKSYKSRYIHTSYLSPASRNSEDISDIETNFGKINHELIPNDIQSIRDYSSLKFYEAMDAVSKYNPYVTLENFENKNRLTNVATLYRGAKSYNDMFDKMDNFIVDLYFDDLIDDNIKTKIEKSTEKFNEYNSGTRYKLALMVGRENLNTYNRFVKEFKPISTNVLRITKTSNGIGNNHQINSKMYEFKNIYEANTKLTSLNKINKALKEIRLIKPILRKK